uniref:Scavenger receptor class B member 1 n=1 Tax=Amblyomma cajennense TaxID=34607 RepID=A0A023FQ89_AMBCJ
MALSRVLVVLGAIGFFLALLGGAGVIFLPRLFTSLLDKKLPLVNNSDVFNLWQNIPLPIYRKFYFFNLTNPKEFVANKAKPKLEEVGPYSYRVTWIKKNITWNSNGTVSYREVKTYSLTEIHPWY